jgi:hypothetical protein
MLVDMRTAARHSRPQFIGAVLCLAFASGCAGNDRSERMQTKHTQQAASEFMPQVEQALSGLGIARESLEVRANPCEGQQGEASQEAYYIWVGLRGSAQAGDAAGLIQAAHERWQAAGWEIGRFRQLDNGGANLTATDPATGHTYTLDAGFRNAPASALAGFFNTPCYRSPDGPVTFGRIG